MAKQPSEGTKTSSPSKNGLRQSLLTLVSSTRRIILLSFALGILLWIIDAFLDFITFYRGQGTFWELLILAPPPHELYIRIVMLVFFILFGWTIAFLFRHQKNIENTLAIEQAELRATLYSIGDAVIATDTTGGIVRMNPIAEQLTGWSEAEGIGMPLDDVFRIINEETRNTVENPAVRVLQEGVIVGLANHTLLISKNGKEFPIADAGAPIFDQDHQITGVVLIFRDQTEERLTQQLILSHLELIQYAADHTLAEIQTLGLNICQLLSDSEISFFRQIADDGIQPLYKHFSSPSSPFVFHSSNPKITAYPFTTPQMEICIQSRQPAINKTENATAISDDKIFNELIVPVVREDQVVAVLGVGNKSGDYTPRDIEVITFLADIIWETIQKKLVQETLQISEDNYRSLFHNILNGFALHKIVLDENGTPIDYIFLEVNKAFEALTDLHRENILGKKVTEVLPGIENDPGNWIGRYGEVAKTSEEIHFEQYSQNLDRWYAVLAYSPKPGYFATIFQDVTKQKKATQELKESQRQLSTLMDNLPGMVYRCKNDADWSMEFISQGSKKLTGYSPEEIIGSAKISYNEIVHPDDRQLVWDTVQAGVDQRRSFQITYRIITAEGENKWVWEQGQAVTNSDGEVIALEGVISDITEQKIAEEALQNQAMMMENVSDAVITTDINFTIQRWNNAAEEMLGWKESEAIGKTIHEVSPISYPVITRQEALEAFHKNGMWKGEAIHQHKNGSAVHVLSTVSLARDKQGNPIGIIAINKDITEIKRQQEILNAQREKLSALAQEVLTAQENERMLLSRDLHDTLGQALAVHKIYINIFEHKIRQSSPDLIPDLEKIIESIDTASQISRSLSHSLRPPDLDALGLEISLRNLCSQTAQVSDKKIDFHSNLGEDFHTDADITLYRVGQEALNNVLKHSEATEIIFSCIVDDDAITLKVSDNGIGFDPKILETHRGGLGIIGMSERMEYVGGSFKIESSPNAGTTIIARYPFREKNA